MDLDQAYIIVCSLPDATARESFFAILLPSVAESLRARLESDQQQIAAVEAENAAEISRRAEQSIADDAVIAAAAAEISVRLQSVLAYVPKG